MKFSNVRLLVKDFAKCFKFYSEQLGLEPAWGDENSGYASFKVADGIEGFALFVSDWMAPSVGNANKELPVGFREKSRGTCKNLCFCLLFFAIKNLCSTFVLQSYSNVRESISKAIKLHTPFGVQRIF